MPDRPNRNSEKIKNVYQCQRANPDPGDFKDIELNITDETMKCMSALEYRKLIKTSVRNVDFYELQTLKESHKKVEHNVYINMNCPQGYLTSESITNVQC